MSNASWMLLRVIQSVNGPKGEDKTKQTNKKMGLMGQEAGKPAWPKPAGVYQTISGRRYGRRHAYVSFRPSLAKQDEKSRYPLECEGLELDSVERVPNGASVLSFQESVPVSSVEPPSVNVGTELCVDTEAVACHSYKEGTSEAAPAHKKRKDDKTLQNHSTSNFSEAGCRLKDHDVKSTIPSGLGFVNIDSYEPDSSDGEDEGLAVHLSMEAENRLQQRLDNMLSELEKGVDYLNGVQSYLSAVTYEDSRMSLEESGPVPFRRPPGLDLDSRQQKNRRTVRRRRSSSTDDEALEKFNIVGSCDLKPEQYENDIAVGASVGSYRVQKVTDCKANQEHSSEMVVRPKVRKQISDCQSQDRKKLAPPDAMRNPSTSRQKEFTEVQKDGSDRYAKEKTCTSLFSNLWDSETTEKQSKANSNKAENETLESRRESAIKDSFWAEFEDCSKISSSCNKDGDSSDCSDGEWSMPWNSDLTMEQEHSSSDESWETLPGRDDPELQSSSSLEEDASEFCFHVGDQASLEEGEIPWFPISYGTSSDDETEGVSHFEHPEFLDSNNNLEDDSSISEDLDVEWRLLDEFGDGLGVAQAMSYVDPQFLTYMALEERLAQAMESALAHLESLAIDVEQAHPPATKESIDCLPQITVTEDQSALGQDQCCAICCSEYMKDEIVTELPCHHLFHKPCVTLWLQKSGTCPVCRHVLVPVLPEAAAATSFLPDHDTLPSVHSAAGMR
ncbi:E3 ubiquitin-protein ligase Praja-2 isoform X2 [Latimeria chalumnae]|uniref:E3 ubiquitin-protein ligase Praja-2 isoform X2 n=1 Tax=Latimeria chalumnae TaxID=7897 RepID=UPI00313CD150